MIYPKLDGLNAATIDWKQGASEKGADLSSMA